MKDLLCSKLETQGYIHQDHKSLDGTQPHGLCLKINQNCKNKEDLIEATVRDIEYLLSVNNKKRFDLNINDSKKDEGLFYVTIHA